MKELDLKIVKAVYGGDSLGHATSDPSRDGKAIFVPLTLPGETARVHITEERRTLAKAEVDTILVSSKDRIDAPCPHFGFCGGCQYQHASYEAQIAMKREILSETLSRAGVSIPGEIAVLAKEPWGYRNRIRVALTYQGEIAYRGRRSNDLVPFTECPIAAPLLVVAARQVAQFVAENPSSIGVTEVELFTNQDHSELLITLFCEPGAEVDEAWLVALRETLPIETRGIRLQIADGGLSPTILASVGESKLTYTVAGFDYRVDHGAFFQVNRWIVDDFVSEVLGEAKGAHAWDLYAGVGLFARQLTTRFVKVTAVEAAPASLVALEANLAGATAHAVASTILDFLRRNREAREPRPRSHHR